MLLMGKSTISTGQLFNSFLSMFTRLGTPHSITGWWFGTCPIFQNIWNVICPIDFHIFQDSYSTTNQIYYSLDQVLITNNHY